MSDTEKGKREREAEVAITRKPFELDLPRTRRLVFVQEKSQDVDFYYWPGAVTVLSHTQTCIWQESSCIPNLKAFSPAQIDLS